MNPIDDTAMMQKVTDSRFGGEHCASRVGRFAEREVAVSNCMRIRTSKPLGNRAATASAAGWFASLNRVSSIGVRAGLLACAALLMNMVLSPGWAQIAALPQPAVALTDENDVDLLSLNLYLHQTVLSIGSAEHPLTETIRSAPDGDWADSMTNDGNLFGFPYLGVPDSFSLAYIGGGPHCSGWGSCTWVSFGGSSEPFASSSTGLSPVKPTGDALVLNADGTYTFTKRDGTRVLFELVNSQVAGDTFNTAKEVIYPDGRVLTYSYATLPSGLRILTSITRNDGLQLHFTYGATPFTWNSTSIEGPTAVTAINTAYEYCDPAAITCSLTEAWPTATFSFSAPSGNNDVFTVTDSAGRVTRYTTYDYSGWGLTNTGPGYVTVGVKLPSSTGGDNVTYQYCYTANCAWAPQTTTNNNYQSFVAGVTRDGNVWNYTGSVDSTGTTITPYIVTYGSTNPVGASEQVKLYSCLMLHEDGNQYCLDPLINFTNRQGELFTAEDYGMEIQNALMPEGNQTNYTWDARGNLTQESLIGKPGTALSVGLSAGYDATCANPYKCNEPNLSKDGNLNETDYTFDPRNGEVATVTLPPDAKGIRPQTNYTYAQQSALALNASKQYVASSPIWVLATKSYCRTSAATTDAGTGQVDCAVGTNDKVLTTYYYGPSSGPNNLFLRGEQVTADGQSHVTCYAYDRFGNRISVTTPNAGVALASCP